MLSHEALEEMTYVAAKKAFTCLFAAHSEDFYYCTLITYGEATGPTFSAWSREALDRISREQSNPLQNGYYKTREQAIYNLKWSYSESPYFCFMDELFEPVKDAFQARNTLLGTDQWDAEVNGRMQAMENAMIRLDREGVFGTGEARNKMVVLVEVMPPDWTNTARAKRMNPPEALVEWLAEYDNS